MSTLQKLQNSKLLLVTSTRHLLRAVLKVETTPFSLAGRPLPTASDAIYVKKSRKSLREQPSIHPIAILKLFKSKIVQSSAIKRNERQQNKTTKLCDRKHLIKKEIITQHWQGDNFWLIFYLSCLHQLFLIDSNVSLFLPKRQVTLVSHPRLLSFREVVRSFLCDFRIADAFFFLCCQQILCLCYQQPYQSFQHFILLPVLLFHSRGEKKAISTFLQFD